MTSPAPAAERARQLAALANGPLKAVERATKNRETAAAKLADADTAWRAALAQAVDAGAPVNDVAAAAKVHRSRVWQLLKRPAEQ